MPHTLNSQLPAGLFRRLAAFIYDSLLLIAIYFAIGGVAVAINGGESIPLSWSLAILLVFFPLAIFCFYSWFWRRSGQTLGMQAWRIKLAFDTSPPPLLLCATRLLVATLSAALLGIGFFWILIDRDRRSWHDIASKSRIILLPKHRTP